MLIKQSTQRGYEKEKEMVVPIDEELIGIRHILHPTDFSQASMTAFRQRSWNDIFNVRFIRLGWWEFQLLATFILVIGGIPNFSDAAQSTPPSEAVPGSAPRNPTDSKREVTVAGDARVGKELFEKHCVTCHGPRGKGDGLKIVGAEVADLTSVATQRKLNIDLLKTIHEGRPEKVMPPWKWRFSAQQAKDVLAYVRTLGR
ncbi:MAG: c-type cytochrome [Nitrospira sp.]